MCRYDKEANWYAAFELELMRFTGNSDAVLDDQFDSAAILSAGFDSVALVEEEDFYSDNQWEMEEGFRTRGGAAEQGRSVTTGY